MSDGPINLNRVRKDRARTEKRALSDANSAKYGRTREQRVKEADQRVRDARKLDQHHRDDAE